MATKHYKTKIVLYKGVPFSIDYNNTLAPSVISSKKACLDDHFTFDEYTDLQTIHMNSVTDTGVMRLVTKAVDAYKYNYAYIEDYHHGLKFFAFITGCRYINDADSNSNTPIPELPDMFPSTYKCVFEFVFAKDLMMTYLNDNYITSCPILRHTSTRRFNNGYHTESLSLQTVDYSLVSTNVALGYLTPKTDTYTVLWCSFNWNNTATAPNSTLNGILNCVLGLVYKSTVSVQQDLVTLSHEAGFQLLGVSTIPNFMFDYDNAPALSTISGRPLVDAYVHDKHTFDVWSKAHYKSVIETNAGYTVKNKKCFYFPFVKIVLESNAGSVVELAPEYINKISGVESNIYFDVACNVGRPCSYTVFPRDYGVVSQAHSPNIKCTTSTFPEGCATLDSYAMYLSQRYKFPGNPIGMFAQHLVEAVPGIIGAAANMGVSTGGVMTGSEISVDTPVGKTGTGMYSYSGERGAAAAGLGGALSSAAQGMLTADAMKRKPDAIVGAVPSPDTDYIRNNVDVVVKLNAVHPKELKGLDDYFEKYGYSQGGVIALPDLAGRDRYIYCQTGGYCFHSPECNANENTKINNIMMSGVTYWQPSAVVTSNIPLAYGDNGTDPIADAM